MYSNKPPLGILCSEETTSPEKFFLRLAKILADLYWCNQDKQKKTIPRI